MHSAERTNPQQPARSSPPTQHPTPVRRVMGAAPRLAQTQHCQQPAARHDFARCATSQWRPPNDNRRRQHAAARPGAHRLSVTSQRMWLCAPCSSATSSAAASPWAPNPALAPSPRRNATSTPGASVGAAPRAAGRAALAGAGPAGAGSCGVPARAAASSPCRANHGGGGGGGGGGASWRQGAAWLQYRRPCPSAAPHCASRAVPQRNGCCMPRPLVLGRSVSSGSSTLVQSTSLVIP